MINPLDFIDFDVNRFNDYVNDVLFAADYYYFESKNGKKYTGYCTKCKNEVEQGNNKFKHKEKIVCPFCKTEVEVRKAGISRTHMVENGYFLIYEISPIDKKVLVLYRVKVTRDYRNDYKKISNNLRIDEVIIFDKQPIHMYLANSGWKRLDKVIDITSDLMYGCYKRSNNLVNRNELATMIKGTHLEYCCVELFNINDRKHFNYALYFDLYLKYPVSIEILMKSGLDSIVYGELYGSRTWGTYDLSKHTLKDILKLSNKQHLNLFLKYCDKSYISYGSESKTALLKLLQIAIRKKEVINDNLMQFLVDKGQLLIYKNTLYKYGRYTKTINYLNSQVKTLQNGNYTVSAYAIVDTYVDYLNELRILKMDLTDTNNLYPKRLINEHDKLSELVRQLRAKEKNEKVERRAEVLNKYIYGNGKYIIKPYQNANEIIEEGAKLTICIASNYMNKYSNGQCILLALRKAHDLDTPFYAMEIRNKKLIQIQGDKHKTPSQNGDLEVIKFVKEYMMKVFKTVPDIEDVKIKKKRIA